MNGIIKYIFYLTSITYSPKPTSEIIILQEDSITYWDTDRYVTKAIIYKKHSMFVIKDVWFHINMKTVEMYQFGTKKRRKYKVRWIADQDKNLIKDKPDWLN